MSATFVRPILVRVFLFFLLLFVFPHSFSKSLKKVFRHHCGTDSHIHTYSKRTLLLLCQNSFSQFENIYLNKKNVENTPIGLLNFYNEITMRPNTKNIGVHCCNKLVPPPCYIVFLFYTYVI